jgi:hypothetical protein
MSLDAFAGRYRALFALLGQPLKPEDGWSPDTLAHLNLEGVRLPEALRAYYLVAGNERRLNHSFNRLLALEDVFVEAGRLVFMEENQNVVYWGVSGDDANPMVEQGVNLHPEPLAGVASEFRRGFEALRHRSGHPGRATAARGERRSDWQDERTERVRAGRLCAQRTEVGRRLARVRRVSHAKGADQPGTRDRGALGGTVNCLLSLER